MSILSRRHAVLDARVADARERAENARAEAELSAARHEQICEHVVKPLRQRAEQNMFAEMLRASLIEGHGRNP